MSHEVEKILVVTKSGDRKSADLGLEMTDFLASIGVESAVCEHHPEACRGEEDIDDKFDLILVLGGDGTFIGVARTMLAFGVPLMGVNLGRVGFLTQLHRDHWKPWLSKITTEGVNVTRRLTLHYEIMREGEVVHSGLAVNDLVVSRGMLARLIRLGVAYEGVDVSAFRSDGLIISTPTGSTAYGVSAGGPLLHANLFAYSVTPICPFLNSFKPLVLPADGRCEVLVEEVRGDVSVTVDGQASIELKHGDRIVVSRSNADLKVVDLGPEAYFEKLKKHGFLTEK